MQLIETESGRREHAGSRSRGTSSPARRGTESPSAPAAPRTLGARLRALEGNVWLPVVTKALALIAGMIALAAVGASSLARGSGVVPPASAEARPHARTAVASLGPPFSAPVSAAGALEAGAGRAEPGDGGAPSPATTADGKIILNLAGPDELRHLPGIGPKRADAIVALRTKLGGRFKRVTDLLRVKGIGPKGMKKIEPLVVLDAPKTS
jgi:competence protein ComEA